jgi:hypothetical protein
MYLGVEKAKQESTATIRPHTPFFAPEKCLDHLCTSHAIRLNGGDMFGKLFDKKNLLASFARCPSPPANGNLSPVLKTV